MAYLDLPQKLQNYLKQAEKASDHKIENVHQTTQYIPLNSMTPKPVVNTVTIEEFVAQHLKV